MKQKKAVKAVVRKPEAKKSAGEIEAVRIVPEPDYLGPEFDVKDGNEAEARMKMFAHYLMTEFADKGIAEEEAEMAAILIEKGVVDKNMEKGFYLGFNKSGHIIYTTHDEKLSIAVGFIAAGVESKVIVDNEYEAREKRFTKFIMDKYSDKGITKDEAEMASILMAHGVTDRNIEKGFRFSSSPTGHIFYVTYDKKVSIALAFIAAGIQSMKYPG